MTKKAKAFVEKKEAIDFANSMRGRFILSQALMVAIERMKMVPSPLREDSNIADMQYLLDNCFPLYRDITKALKWGKKR